MAIGRFIGALLAATLTFGVAEAQETLKIGVIAPLTGPGATWGFAAKLSAEIAAEEVNAAGGLDIAGTKYTVEAIAYDDQYKASEAISAYNRLVTQDGARFLMTATSAPTMAIKDAIEEDNVLALTSAFAPALIDANTRHMIRLYSTSNEYMPGYVKWMGDNLTERKIVTINPNDETGWTHAEITGKLYTQNGFEVLSSELYERTNQDFAPQVTKILAMQPEAIDVGSSSPATAALIVRQARDLGYKGRFIQTGGSGWPQILEAVGPEGAEGLVNSLWTDPYNPGFQRLADIYRKQIGQEPNELIAPYYDAWHLLFDAMKKAGTVEDIDAIVAAFPAVLPKDSVQGQPMTWSGRMQVLTTEYVSVIKDGKPDIVGTIQ